MALVEAPAALERQIALPQFRQQHIGVGREARLGIAHGGKGLGVVRRTPVTLAIHQRVAVAEVLGHKHHCLVGSAVAVGMEFADHVAHRTGGFFELGAGFKPQLTHGINDATLHRLQAVTDMGQGPVEYHVHGVVQVGLLRVFLQRDLLDAVFVEF